MHRLIKKMPTRELLEKFVQHLGGAGSVYFDTEKGEFVDADKRNVKKKVHLNKLQDRGDRQ